jgi:hypothetical protein
MKTAKEWAESVVCGQVPGTKSYVWLDDGQSQNASIVSEQAIGIIERLVERAQVDARAPLEEEIARLRAENERLNAEHVEYRAFIADANDMLAEDHDQIRKANQ